MFRKKSEETPPAEKPLLTERVTSVLGPGIVCKGSLNGTGGVRIEGAFDGEIALRGLLVIGSSGRVTCSHMRAKVVIVAGAVQGDITAEKVEIRSTGRVWGNVVTAAFATEEGAFMRGQIRMEDELELDTFLPAPAPQAEAMTGEEELSAATEDGAREPSDEHA